MSWNDLKLADVVIEDKKFPEIPLGEYTFELLPGAALRFNNFGTEELVVSAAITEGGDGKQIGRRAFMQYPDPESVNSKTGEKAAWSAQALKKLEIALGTDINEGETPAEYLNRVASNGHSHFKMTIVPARKLRAGETEPRSVAALFSVAPAA